MLDFLIQAQKRVAYLEVKYQLSSKAGEQLNRLIGQLKTAATAATNGEGIAVVTFKEPSVEQMKAVLEALDSTSVRVPFMHGFNGLVKWLDLYF